MEEEQQHGAEWKLLASYQWTCNYARDAQRQPRCFSVLQPFTEPRGTLLASQA